MSNFELQNFLRNVEHTQQRHLKYTRTPTTTYARARIREKINGSMWERAFFSVDHPSIIYSFYLYMKFLLSISFMIIWRVSCARCGVCVCVCSADATAQEQIDCLCIMLWIFFVVRQVCIWIWIYAYYTL